MIGFSGVGVYVPKERIYIEQLAPELSAEERKCFGAYSVLHEPSLTATEMAIEASKEAIKDAGIQPTDIDLIINTQATLHDYLMWSVSAEIQNQLGARNAVFFDMFQGCSGFLAAMIVAESFIRSKEAKTVLVNSSEKWDACLPTRRMGRMVYGECGAAVILQEDSQGSHIIGHSDISRGEFNDISRMQIGTINPPNKQYEDSSCFYNAVNIEKSRQQMIPVNIDYFYQVGKQAVESSGLTLNDVDFIIFPNVGFGLFQKIIDRYEFDIEKTNFCYAAETGDCGPGDVILSYYRVLKSGKLKKGDNVLILTQGSGFTWMAMIIKV